MTVIPFPPATDRPKPGKEPPEVSAQILILPVVAIVRDLTADTSFNGTLDEAERWLDEELLLTAAATVRTPADAGSD